MDRHGYIYIPNACKKGQYCSSLVFLHDIKSGARDYRDTESRRTGLLEYAALNNIIVVFPQNYDGMMYGPFLWTSVRTHDMKHPQI